MNPEAAGFTSRSVVDLAKMHPPVVGIDRREVVDSIHGHPVPKLRSKNHRVVINLFLDTQPAGIVKWDQLAEVFEQEFGYVPSKDSVDHMMKKIRDKSHLPINSIHGVGWRLIPADLSILPQIERLPYLRKAEQGIAICLDSERSTLADPSSSTSSKWQWIELSPIENKVVGHLITNKGKLCSSSDIGRAIQNRVDNVPLSLNYVHQLIHGLDIKGLPIITSGQGYMLRKIGTVDTVSQFQLIPGRRTLRTPDGTEILFTSGDFEIFSRLWNSQDHALSLRQLFLSPTTTAAKYQTISRLRRILEPHGWTIHLSRDEQGRPIGYMLRQQQLPQTAPG